MRIAVRAESGGYMKISNVRYDSQDWQSFIHYLWPLQWTNVETPLNDELNEKLFILSKGKHWIGSDDLSGAQLKVIGSGNEIITGAVLSASVPVLVSHTEEYKDTLLPGQRLKTRKPNGSLHLMKVMLRLSSCQRSP